MLSAISNAFMSMFWEEYGVIVSLLFSWLVFY